MRNTFCAALAVCALICVSLTVTAPAHADSTGAAIAAGVGGLAAGALLGGALVRPPAPVYEAAPAPVYVEPPPPNCWREKRPIYDEYGEVIEYRLERVCE